MRVVNFLTLCHHSLGHEKKVLLNGFIVQITDAKSFDSSVGRAEDCRVNLRHP